LFWPDAIPPVAGGAPRCIDVRTPGLLEHRVRGDRPCGAPKVYTERPPYRRSIAFAALAVAAAFSYWFGAEARTPVYGLQVDARELSVGEVWETDRFSRSFTIRNQAQSAIDVIDLICSCGSVSITPQSFSLKPDEEQTILVVIDLTAKDTASVRRTVRDFAVSIMPVTSSGPHSRSWTISGTVKTVITTDDPFVEIGQLVRHADTAHKSVPFFVHRPPERIREISPACDPAFASVVVRQDGADRYVLDVAPNPEIPPGPFKFPVTLRVFSTDGSLLLTSAFLARGVALEDIQLVPSELALGMRKIGTAWKGKALVHSISGQPFSIEGMDVIDNIIIKAAMAEMDTEHVVDLSGSITRDRDSEAFAYLTCKRADNKTRVVPLRVTYFGVR